MRKSILLVLIGILVVLATVGEPWAKDAFAFWPLARDVQSDQAQNQPGIPDGLPSFLTGPNAGEAPQIALSYLRQNRATLGLVAEDLTDVVVKDQYVTEHNGVTHLYLRQRYHGIELFNGDINANIGPNGEVINIGNRFMYNLAGFANTDTPELSAADALAAAAQQMHWELSAPLTVIEEQGGASRALVLSGGGISSRPIPVHLIYVRVSATEARLAWNAKVYEVDELHVWNLAIDAVTGDVLLKQDLIIPEHAGFTPQTDRQQEPGDPLAPGEPITDEALEDGPMTEEEAAEDAQAFSPLRPPVYGVFALPLESPQDGVGLPSSQTVVLHPFDRAASPYGWHDIDASPGHEFRDTRGNNVSAQEDRNGDNVDGFRPTGRRPWRFNFLYPFDPALEPTGGVNTLTSIVNLFYMTNVIHDIAYRYGFNEASGNFQHNNYGRGGLDGDSVQADAQDAFDFGERNNAFWEATPDGVAPRTGMFVFDLTSPNRESALDNGIIIHEYGHGISTRLVGGPSNAFCLFNAETMGEGWSDWFALVLTAKPGDVGAKARGMGTYVLGQPPDGPGIRRVPYSTDMSIDPQTYDWLKRSGETHDVGEVWASMLWETYWALVDQHGFDPNLYTGTGGNNLALRLVMDGMKLTNCEPGFVDARNGVLIADYLNTGGENLCTIWGAFAKRGLGYSADQGSPYSTADGTEAFDIPPACRDELALVKSATLPVVEAGEVLDYVLEATNYTSEAQTGLVLSDAIPAGTTYVPGSASEGGSESGGVITWQLPDLNPDEGALRTFQVVVDRDFPDAQQIFFDDVEGGSDNWEATGLWHIETDGDPCGNSFSPTHSWYFGQASGCFYTDESFGQLTTAQPVALPNGVATLSFMSWQDLELCCDQGSVLVSTDGDNYTPVWSTTTSSGTWQEVTIDLSAYSGQNIWLRFQFTTDSSVTYWGWYIDDIEIQVAPTVDNFATLTSHEGQTATAETHTPVIKVAHIEVAPTAFDVVLPIGTSATRTLTISNTGTAPLSFAISPLRREADDIAVSSAPASPQPAESVQIPAFQPDQESDTPSYAGKHLVAREEALYQAKAEALSIATADASAVNVLLLAAADVSQIQAILLAFPNLATVDFFDARFDTPTLEALLAYDTVVVIGNNPFADPNAVGNVLADYVDNQGTVVQTVPTFFDPSGSGWGITGRWLAEGYSPLIGFGDWFSFASLGDFDSSHPIMQGVDEASDVLRQMVDLAPEAQLVASWTDDEFVATKDGIVALNTFIADGNSWGGDIDLIVYNSIIWLQDQGGEPAPWLTVNPVSGTIPSGATQTVEVTFDASAPEITPGDYNALLRIRSNAPEARTLQVPADMHVFGPELSIIGGPPTWMGRPAEATVHFASNGFDLAATTFSVDFDESCLSFDPSDNDGNGIPDAISFATPADLQTIASVDLGDTDGEIDIFIADTSLPLSAIADGALATIHFTATCLPEGEAQQVSVGFSSDPRASFSDLGGVSVPATAYPGFIEVGAESPGDCNQDGKVDSADAISCLLELFDGDGSFWLDAPGGTFPGSPQGCDANQDTQIDAADMTCTVLIIFQGPNACLAASSESTLQATAAASLAIPDALSSELGAKVAVPVNFAGNGNAIAATAFVLTYDPAQLQLDPTDGNGDGIPDAVTLHVPSRYAKSVTLDGAGRIQIALADVALPFMPLSDGPLATINFTAAAGGEVALGFAGDYPVSFGSTKGTSVPASAEGGSVSVIETEPSGGTPAPVDPTPATPEPETPQEPKPEEPVATPQPTEPAPVEPQPTEPGPTEPTAPEPEEPELPEPQVPEQTQRQTFLPVAPK